MGLRELFRVAWAALRAHTGRSLLTTLGIVIAVWTIVSVLAVITGLNDYMRQVFSLSPDVFVVTRFGIITSREEFFDALKRKEITTTEAESLRQLCGSCAEVGEVLNASLPVRSEGRRIPDVPIVGGTANSGALQNVDIEAGRYFTEAENEHRAAVAIIGSEIRDELFPRLDPMLRTMWIGGVPHQIIGVLAKQGSILGQNRDLIVYTPLKTLEKQVGHQRGRSMNVQASLLVKAAGGIPGVPAAQDEVIQIFRWLRHIPIASNNQPVGTVTAEMLEVFWKQISFTTFLVVSLMSGISLVVGAIVVANIMLVSVIERTHEIGLRLALGARKRDIRLQFLIESAMLALAGGAIGALTGWITALIVDANAPVPAEVHASLIIAAMATAGFTGLAAGFFPARAASRLTPIEALRRD